MLRPVLQNDRQSTSGMRIADIRNLPRHGRVVWPTVHEIGIDLPWGWLQGQLEMIDVPGSRGYILRFLTSELRIDGGLAHMFGKATGILALVCTVQLQEHLDASAGINAVANLDCLDFTYRP